LIGSQRDLQVCGSAGSIREALQQVAKDPPDVLVADLSLKDGLGLELIKTVKERHPQIRILVVSAYEESQYAERVLRSGALGYVNKYEYETKLLEGIRTVQAGDGLSARTSCSVRSVRLSAAVTAKNPCRG
jgi:DNA-binding NarL/FixJ family response regulator